MNEITLSRIVALKKFFGFAILSFAITVSTGCSNSREMNNSLSSSGYRSAETFDPLEPLNRVVFNVNGVVDKVFFRPVTQVYRAILPQVAQDSVQSFLRNLRSPVDFANSVLQGDMDHAGTVIARFLMNSTVGVAGLIDVAETKGYEYRREDFGQTLAVWGVGDGPYVVLPIFGPSNLRDTVGLVVDTVSDPITINSYKKDRDWVLYGRAGLTIVDTKARLMDPLEEIERNSLDYYAAIRSIYKQFREAQIQNRGNNQGNFATAAAPSGVATTNDDTQMAASDPYSAYEFYDLQDDDF